MYFQRKGETLTGKFLLHLIAAHFLWSTEINHV